MSSLAIFDVPDLTGWTSSISGSSGTSWKDNRLPLIGPPGLLLVDAGVEVDGVEVDGVEVDGVEVGGVVGISLAGDGVGLAVGDGVGEPVGDAGAAGDDIVVAGGASDTGAGAASGAGHGPAEGSTPWLARNGVKARRYLLLRSVTRPEPSVLTLYWS